MSSEVYVAFSHDSGRWWSCFLHPYIKHCEILIVDKGKYIHYNKTLGEIEIYTSRRMDDILQNSILVHAERSELKGLFSINTCVGHVKQFLGINNPFILTPYQLYKRLTHGKLITKSAS